MNINSIEEVAETLASLYTSIIRDHDIQDFENLKKQSSKLLRSIGVKTSGIKKAADLVTQMYVLSDEADRHLQEGSSIKHDEKFNRIYECAKILDKLLEISEGSVNDEIHWWYHFRLARSMFLRKKPSLTSKIYHLLLAFAWMVFEHKRRIDSFYHAFLCSIYLAKAGLWHTSRSWKETEKNLEKYWRVKIMGNNNRIEPKLILV